MILTILRGFTIVNVIIGLALVAAAVRTGPDTTDEKSPILVVIYMLWAFFFLVLSWLLFYVKPLARKWTIGLYGFASFGTLALPLSLMAKQDVAFVYFPGIHIAVYSAFFVFFFAPVIFMLRRNVKEFFIRFEQARIKTEEDNARASLKSRQ